MWENGFKVRFHKKPQSCLPYETKEFFTTTCRCTLPWNITLFLNMWILGLNVCSCITQPLHFLLIMWSSLHTQSRQQTMKFITYQINGITCYEKLANGLQASTHILLNNFNLLRNLRESSVWDFSFVDNCLWWIFTFPHLLLLSFIIISVIYHQTSTKTLRIMRQ